MLVVVNIYHGVRRHEKAVGVDYFHYIVAHPMPADAPYP